MAQVFFHYSTPRGVVWKGNAAEVNDLPDLREYATRFIESLISAPSLEDWRVWVLHVSDERGKELFSMPFLDFLGKPH